MAQLQTTTINDTGFMQLPSGTTAQRPASPVAGMIRYNTSLGWTEWYDGTYSTWVPTGLVFPIATGGTITNITSSGLGFRVHSFTTSGTFTVTRGGEIDYLIVGGGGSGADTGGGGAGGVLQGKLIVTPQAYTITVAAATAAFPDNSAPGYNGNPSSAFGFIALGGGGAGGGFTTGNGNTGASGGGNGRDPGGSLFGTTGHGIPGQGFCGGNPNPVGDWEGGGGGGAGAPGQDGRGNEWAGDGGPGASSNITGTMTFYGGGGGGGSNSRPGTGGLGGGNTPATGGAGSSGAANTGGGGGGGWSGDAGAGGSGVVIVRYRTS